ncbi:hypothetical protein [Schumannella luteola]
MTRFWLWVQPALAIILFAHIVYTLVAFAWQDFPGSFVSIQFVIDGAFVFPGLVISLAVNQVILMLRKPRLVTRVEAIMIGILVALTAALVVTSFPDDAIVAGLFLWPVLILFAIAVTIVLAVTSARLAREKSPQTTADDAEMDELFAGGED